MQNCGSLCINVSAILTVYSSGPRRRIRCRLALIFVPTLPGRYCFTAEGAVFFFLLFLLEPCGIVEVFTSTFLQFLQFCSEKGKKPLPFGTEICSYVAWEVLIYGGRRRFRLSSISFRAMWNCGILYVNGSLTLTVLF